MDSNELWTLIKDFFSTSDEVKVALITAGISLLTLLVATFTKNPFEKIFLLFKLETEHTFEQRKKIKDVLARLKSPLLEACENLNHRLWNLSTHGNYGKTKMDGKYIRDKGDNENEERVQNFHYFHTLAYRILVVYACFRKIQNELIHLDSSVAAKDELNLLKYIRFFGILFTDTSFYRDFYFEREKEVDHFFKNHFDEFCFHVMDSSRIITFNEYLSRVPAIEEALRKFYKYLDGINPEEARLRWERLHLLKLLNIAFLNTYGYDYHHTSLKKTKIAINTPRKPRILRSFIFLMERQKLEKDKSARRLLRILQRIESSFVERQTRRLMSWLKTYSKKKSTEDNITITTQIDQSNGGDTYLLDFRMKIDKKLNAKLIIFIKTASKQEADLLSNGIQRSLNNEFKLKENQTTLSELEEQEIGLKKEIVINELNAFEKGTLFLEVGRGQAAEGTPLERYVIHFRVTYRNKIYFPTEIEKTIKINLN